MRNIERTSCMWFLLGAALLSAGTPSWAGPGAKRAYRSPGKPRAPVVITVTSPVVAPAAGQAIPVVAEAAPTVDTEAFSLEVRLPPGLQLLTGSARLEPEHVPAGESRRLELQVIALAPGSYTLPVVATVRVGGHDQSAVAGLALVTAGAEPAARAPMLRQKLKTQPGYDDRYVTVPGKVED